MVWGSWDAENHAICVVLGSWDAENHAVDLVADGDRAFVDYDQQVGRSQVCDTATQQVEFQQGSAETMRFAWFGAAGMPKTMQFAWFWAAGMPKTMQFAWFWAAGMPKTTVFAWFWAAEVSKTTFFLGGTTGC